MPERGTPEKWKNHFINRATEKWGAFYDYSHVEYKNARTKVKIDCPLHGFFEVTPDNHLKFSCYHCGIERGRKNLTLDQDAVISDFKKKHGEKYDYSFVEYTHWNKPVKIVCREHGSFEQRARSHMRGARCPHCAAANHGGSSVPPGSPQV